MELPVVPQAICVLERREEDDEKESDAIVSFSQRPIIDTIDRVVQSYSNNGGPIDANSVVLLSEGEVESNGQGLITIVNCLLCGVL